MRPKVALDSPAFHGAPTPLHAGKPSTSTAKLQIYGEETANHPRGDSMSMDFQRFLKNIQLLYFFNKKYTIITSFNFVY